MPTKSAGRDVEPLVVVVEDDPSIARLITMYLGRDGYRVHHETDGRAGLAAIRTRDPRVVLLDLRLPSLGGLDVCRELRAEGNDVPVIIVSARDEEVDRIVGLEIGADDYVTKPFSPRELMARVTAVLRRSTRDAASSPVAGGNEVAAADVLVCGNVRLDRVRRRCHVGPDGEREVALTATEFALLAELMGRPGRVFSRDELLSAVWGYSDATTRTVDVHVAQLRAKLGDDSPIRTVRGVGYGVDD